jgi:hypothetical protein
VASTSTTGLPSPTALAFGDSQDIYVNYIGGTDTLTFIPSGAGKSIDYGTTGGAQTTNTWWDAAGDYIRQVPTFGQVNVDSNLSMDAASTMYFGATVPGAPADGCSLHGSAHSLSLNCLDADEYFVFGDNAQALDVGFWGENGAGADGEELFWDYSESALAFYRSAKEYFTDDTRSCFGTGGGLAAPDVCTEWDTAPAPDVLFTDPSNGASITWQLGTAAANHGVTLDIGDPATAAVRINGNATASQTIQYMLAARPVETVFLPGGSFQPALHAPAITSVMGGNGTMYGLESPNANAHSIQSIWTVPKWVDTAVNVTGYVNYACDTTGVTTWTVNYAAMTPDTTATNTAGADDTSSVDTTTINEYFNSSGDAFVVAAASLDNTKPLRLTVTRDVADANGGDCSIYGVTLLVTRKYAD